MSVQRIPLVGTLTDRTGASGSDILLENCYVEQPRGTTDQSPDLYVVKRPGLVEVRDLTDGAGRGITMWDNQEIAVVGNTVYIDGSAATNNLATTTGNVSMAMADESARRLIIGDGDDGKVYYLQGTTLNTVADGDVPDPFLPYLQNFDTYNVVGTQDAEIWNSATIDVTTWGSADFVTSEGKADRGVCLQQYLDYLVMFNEFSTEFFWDAANTNGSPFSVYQGHEIQVGMPIGCGWLSAKSGDNLYWVGIERGGGLGVYAFMGDFKPKKISNQAVDSLLEAEGTNLSNGNAFPLSVAGKRFVCFNLPTTADLTLVYDTELNLWYKWTLAGGGHLPVRGTAAVNNDCRVLHKTNGKVLQFSDTNYQDDGSTFTVTIQTPTWDGQTKQEKECNLLRLIGDIAASTNNVTIEWTDDDWQNVTSFSRTIDMSSEASMLDRMGSFKRRAWRLSHAANAALRLKELEADIVTGHYGR